MHLTPLLVLLGPPHSSQACLTCWWVCMHENMGTRVTGGGQGALVSR